MSAHFQFLTILIFILISNCNGISKINFFKKFAEYRKTDGEKCGPVKIFYHNPDLIENWGIASMFCKSYGLDLATLETKEEETFLLGEIKQMFDPKKRFLIGGTNMGSDFNSWYWASTGKAINYNMNWTPGEPTSGPEKCLEIWNVNDNWSLNNVWCKGEHNFICEKILDDENCLESNKI